MPLTPPTHQIPFGATLLPDGSTRFAFWAPDAQSVELLIEPAHGKSSPLSYAMQRDKDGWHQLTHSDAHAGTQYRFLIDGNRAVPDPASRSNPFDVAGPSEVMDPMHYQWKDASWRGRPWHEAVIYELHLGTFTPAGTYVAAMPRLRELAEMGITAIELMPLAEFPGRQSWGYDGVLLFAPDASYGTPDDLKALIDHAHSLGLMVLLDVVYNHFGPQGNHLSSYSSGFFNPAHQTPWGAAINFDAPLSEVVRDFYLRNALMWVNDYHFDGLRLDAVHAIRDDSSIDIVSRIGSALREGPGRDRHVHLVLENDLNQAHRLTGHQPLSSRLPASAASQMPRTTATAQWNDDWHHAAHVLLTGETHAYYADFSDTPLAHLGRALADGFVFQGQASQVTGETPPGEPSAHLPSTAFIAFLQNHDQVGNRAQGDRLHQSADPNRLDAMYACLLLAPHVPMLFMGEEYSSNTPFLYFCDYEGELADAVRKGRRREFGFPEEDSNEMNVVDKVDTGTNAANTIPDPNALSTFEASKLQWQQRMVSPHRERLALITRLIDLRKKFLMPLLPAQRSGGQWMLDESTLAVDWPIGEVAIWRMRLRLSGAPATVDRPAGETIYASGVDDNSNTLSFAPNSIWVGCEHLLKGNLDETR